MERIYLVQRILRWDDDDSRDNTLMTADELIHYIDMQDYCTEDYAIWDVSEFGKMKRIHYAGWQPGCLIQFIDGLGNVVLEGYGTDH